MLPNEHRLRLVTVRAGKMRYAEVAPANPASKDPTVIGLVNDLYADQEQADQLKSNLAEKRIALKRALKRALPCGAIADIAVGDKLVNLSTLTIYRRKAS